MERCPVGAIFTALLFMVGQYLIGLYIQYTAQASAYGAAGSIIVILVWIYYTSAILYIGAEFTQVYAEAMGSSIEPAEYAVHVEQTEVEQEVTESTAAKPPASGPSESHQKSIELIIIVYIRHYPHHFIAYLAAWPCKIIIHE